MSRISIFNYEAFYLDFLEGTLSEEDALLLNQFLEQHPELKVDDLGFLTLENNSLVLDEQFKANLKQISFNETPITTQNIEQFLIAETEGLLSSQKRNELNQLVSKDTGLIKLRKIYASTHLVADKSIVFANKKSLKQSKRIILWPYISLAAASIAIFLLLWNPKTSILDENGTKVSIREIVKDKNSIDSVQIRNIQDNNSEGKQNKVHEGHPIPTTLLNDNSFVEVAENSTKSPSVVSMLKVLEVEKINTKDLDLEILETNYASNLLHKNTVEPENDYTILGFNEMNNPIKPITNRLGDLIKKEVDFRTAKATEKQSGGFYLKLGKLEISKRKC